MKIRLNNCCMLSEDLEFGSDDDDDDYVPGADDSD